MVRRHMRSLLLLAALLAATAACGRQMGISQPSTPAEKQQPAEMDLEGVYEREVTREAAPGATRRQLGGWTLLLEDGGFVIRFESFEEPGSSFESSGRYALRGGKLVLTNDRGCPPDTGVYAFELGEGTLVLTAVEDDCGGGLRASDLTVMPWDRETRR